MKLAKRVFMVLGSILVVLAVIGMVLPSHVRVERSTVINAPPSRVYAYVDSLEAWVAWSPWYEAEPDAKYTYSGPETGEGATVEWVGEVVGTGKQVITESLPHASIKTSLDFGSQGMATADWTFEETDDEGTKVTWGFDTDLGLNPIARYMGLMMNRWIGADYEKGLAKLKSVCEAEPEVTEEESTDDPGAENTDETESGAEDENSEQ